MEYNTLLRIFFLGGRLEWMAWVDWHTWLPHTTQTSTPKYHLLGFMHSLSDICRNEFNSKAQSGISDVFRIVCSTQTIYGTLKHTTIKQNPTIKVGALAFFGRKSRILVKDSQIFSKIWTQAAEWKSHQLTQLDMDQSNKFFLRWALHSKRSLCPAERSWGSVSTKTL